MKNLKKRRKEKGFTCETLGKLINVQKSAVSKYERGAIQPSRDILLKLAQVLDCTTDYLLDITNDPMPHSEKKDPPVITREQALQIIAQDSNLSKKDVEYLKQTIKLLEIKKGSEQLNDEFGEDKTPQFN